MTHDNDMSENLEHKLDELNNANKIEFERVREDIKKLGEGYEDGLRQISKQIQDLDARWAEQWTPHEMVTRARWIGSSATSAILEPNGRPSRRHRSHSCESC